MQVWNWRIIVHWYAHKQCLNAVCCSGESIVEILKVIGRFKHSSGWKKQIKHHSYVTDLFIYFSLFSIIMELFAAQQQMALKV